LEILKIKFADYNHVSNEKLRESINLLLL